MGKVMWLLLQDSLFTLASTLHPAPLHPSPCSPGAKSPSPSHKSGEIRVPPSEPPLSRQQSVVRSTPSSPRSPAAREARAAARAAASGTYYAVGVNSTMHRGRSGANTPPLLSQKTQERLVRERVRVIALDRFGFGESSNVPNASTVDFEMFSIIDQAREYMELLAYIFKDDSFQLGEENEYGPGSGLGAFAEVASIHSHSLLSHSNRQQKEGEGGGPPIKGLSSKDLSYLSGESGDAGQPFSGIPSASGVGDPTLSRGANSIDRHFTTSSNMADLIAQLSASESLPLAGASSYGYGNPNRSRSPTGSQKIQSQKIPIPESRSHECGSPGDVLSPHDSRVNAGTLSPHEDSHSQRVIVVDHDGQVKSDLTLASELSRSSATSRAEVIRFDDGSDKSFGKEHSFLTPGRPPSFADISQQRSISIGGGGALSFNNNIKSGTDASVTIAKSMNLNSLSYNYKINASANPSSSSIRVYVVGHGICGTYFAQVLAGFLKRQSKLAGLALLGAICDPQSPFVNGSDEYDGVGNIVLGGNSECKAAGVTRGKLRVQKAVSGIKKWRCCGAFFRTKRKPKSSPRAGEFQEFTPVGRLKSGFSRTSRNKNSVLRMTPGQPDLSASFGVVSVSNSEISAISGGKKTSQNAISGALVSGALVSDTDPSSKTERNANEKRYYAKNAQPQTGEPGQAAGDGVMRHRNTSRSITPRDNSNTPRVGGTSASAEAVTIREVTAVCATGIRDRRQKTERNSTISRGSNITQTMNVDIFARRYRARMRDIQAKEHTRPKLIDYGMAAYYAKNFYSRSQKDSSRRGSRTKRESQQSRGSIMKNMQTSLVKNLRGTERDELETVDAEVGERLLKGQFFAAKMLCAAGWGFHNASWASEMLVSEARAREWKKELARQKQMRAQKEAQRMQSQKEQEAQRIQSQKSQQANTMEASTLEAPTPSEDGANVNKNKSNSNMVNIEPLNGHRTEEPASGSNSDLDLENSDKDRQPMKSSSNFSFAPVAANSALRALQKSSPENLMTMPEAELLAPPGSSPSFNPGELKSPSFAPGPVGESSLRDSNVSPENQKKEKDTAIPKDSTEMKKPSTPPAHLSGGKRNKVDPAFSAQVKPMIQPPGHRQQRAVLESAPIASLGESNSNEEEGTTHTLNKHGVVHLKFVTDAMEKAYEEKYQQYMAKLTPWSRHSQIGPNSTKFVAYIADQDLFLREMALCLVKKWPIDVADLGPRVHDMRRSLENQNLEKHLNITGDLSSSYNSNSVSVFAQDLPNLNDVRRGVSASGSSGGVVTGTSILKLVQTSGEFGAEASMVSEGMSRGISGRAIRLSGVEVASRPSVGADGGPSGVTISGDGEEYDFFDRGANISKEISQTLQNDSTQQNTHTGIQHDSSDNHNLPETLCPSKLNVNIIEDTIPPPVLVYVGSKDRHTPPQLAKLVQKSIPGSDLRVMEGHNHYSTILEFPNVIRRLMIDITGSGGDGKMGMMGDGNSPRPIIQGSMMGAISPREMQGRVDQQDDRSVTSDVMSIHSLRSRIINKGSSVPSQVGGEQGAVFPPEFGKEGELVRSQSGRSGQGSEKSGRADRAKGRQGSLDLMATIVSSK